MKGLIGAADAPLSSSPADQAKLIRLFLCGDVMTGRGIDQVLPHPGNPVLYEPYMHDAREYVQLAEKVNGTIPLPVDYDYIEKNASRIKSKFNEIFQ